MHQKQYFIFNTGSVSFHHVNIIIPHAKRRVCCSKREPFYALLALLRHVALLKYGNRRLAIPVVTGRCALDPLPQSFDIDVFKCDNDDTIKPNIIKPNLRVALTVVILLLTAIIGRITLKRCQSLAWRVRWHALAFVTRLLDTGHMQPNGNRCYGKLTHVISGQNRHSAYINDHGDIHNLPMLTS